MRGLYFGKGFELAGVRGSVLQPQRCGSRIPKPCLGEAVNPSLCSRIGGEYRQLGADEYNVVDEVLDRGDALWGGKVK